MDISEHSKRIYNGQSNGVENGEKPHTLGKLLDRKLTLINLNGKSEISKESRREQKWRYDVHILLMTGLMNEM